MKKHLSIVAAAALAVGGMGLTSSAFGQDTPPVDNRPAADRAADAARTADTPNKNAEEIHDVLAQVAEAALTKNGLNDIAERFVDADRNRLGQNADALKNTEEVDGRIAQIRTDWKAKYGQDFDIKDEDKVFGGFAMISEGEIGAPRTAGDRVAAPAEGVDAPKANTDGQTAADKNLNDPGRNVATVTIPASHKMAELKVPMIHEAGGWKIDIPDSVDAAKFSAGVKDALTKCGDMKAEWPADETEAYRAVTHSVLSALFADQAAAGAAAQPAAGQAAPAAPAQPQ
ncbi:MAG: hypothetical protein ABIP55_13950 [Tepidisphaeraceae bacterium]